MIIVRIEKGGDFGSEISRRMFPIGAILWLNSQESLSYLECPCVPSHRCGKRSICTQKTDSTSEIRPRTFHSRRHKGARELRSCLLRFGWAGQPKCFTQPVSVLLRGKKVHAINEGLRQSFQSKSALNACMKLSTEPDRHILLE